MELGMKWTNIKEIYNVSYVLGLLIIRTYQGNHIKIANICCAQIVYKMRL